MPSLVLLVSVLSSVSCSQSVQRSSALKVTKSTLAEPGRFPAVALLKKDYAGQYYVYCSGVLIEQQAILTAAHCSADADRVVHEIDDVKVIVGEIYPARTPAAAIDVAEIHVHPLYDPVLMQKDDRGLVVPGEAHDIALWKLASPAPAMTPAAMAPAEGLSEGVITQLVGYGVKSAWSTLEESSLASAPSEFLEEFSIIQKEKVLVNGRWITQNVEYILPARSETEFYLGGLNKPDTCGGDSGGPVFLEDGSGQLSLIGLTSRGLSSCDKGGVYTFVPAYHDWIMGVLAKSGEPVQIGNPVPAASF